MTTHSNRSLKADSGISPKFIQEWIWLHLACSLCFALCAAWLHSLAFAFGIGAGALWGALNIFLLKSLTESYFTDKSYPFKLFWVVIFKFPLLYALGYCLLKINYLPIESLLIGFTSLFLVVFLKGLNLSWAKRSALK